MRRSTWQTTALRAVTLVLVATGSVACSSSTDKAPAEQGASTSQPSASDTGDTLASDGLPKDYPRDSAPLIAGRVASFEHRQGAKDPGWTVLITTEVGDRAALSAAVDLLRGTGWRPIGNQAASSHVRVLDGDQGRIIVTARPQGDQTGVAYALYLR